MNLRPAQIQALEAISDAIAQGKTDIFVQAPTGVGKSVIALKVAEQYSATYRSFILTSERSLQKQYENDCQEKFPEYAAITSISGIDNYKCNINGKNFSLGHCKLAGISNRKALETLSCANRCEYLQRWIGAQNGPTAIFNYSYFLLQQNYVLTKLGEIAPFQSRELVICDEAHLLPDLIERHFACYLNNQIVSDIQNCQNELRADGVFIDFLSVKWGELGKLIGIQYKIPYMDTAKQFAGLENIYRMAVQIRDKIADSKIQLKNKFNCDPDEGFEQNAAMVHASLPHSISTFYKTADSIKDWCCKLEDYLTLIRNSSLDNMIVEGGTSGRIYHILDDTFLFEKYFKPFSKVRIYMSATLQPEALIKRFGLQPEEYEIINLSSGWEPTNSPIVLLDSANFKYANKQNSMESAVQSIKTLLDIHSNERGIIHTTSYDVQTFILDNIDEQHKKRLVTYTGTAEKIAILSKWHEYPEDAVLIGPSLSTGINMTDELARFNIIIKLSFPNVGNPLWRKRFQKKRFIYQAETASILEQSAGRATRHADDYSKTYVLDSRAAKFIKNKSTRQFLSKEFLSRVQ